MTTHTQPAHFSYLLRDHEHAFHPIEKQLRIALRRLIELKALQYKHTVSDFLVSCNSRQASLTSRQLLALHGILNEYTAKLETEGIILPSKEAVQAIYPVETSVQEAKPTVITHTRIDIQRDFILLYLAQGSNFWREKNKFDEVRAIVELGKEQYGDVRFRYEGKDKVWYITLSEKVFLLLVSNKFFSTSTTELLAGAKAYKNIIDERMLEAERQVRIISETKERECQMLVQALGGLTAEFAPGKKLYLHQQQAVEFALHSDHVLVGDETGLGKTYEGCIPAKAWQQTYGYRVYIVTTKSSKGMWLQTCAEVGVRAEIFGWAELRSMSLTEEDFPDDFVLVIDEAQYAANLESQRTQNFLTLAFLSHCKKVIALTGTPFTNGRPWNAYPLLLAMRHPLVWHESAAKRKALLRQYQVRFCGAYARQIGRNKTVWDVTGATNLKVFNSLIQYIPDRNDNHADACMIARRKIDCLDLPEKQRVMDEVELSAEALALHKQAVIQAWKTYSDNVGRKLKEKREELVKKGYTGDRLKAAYTKYAEDIKRAEALVGCGILRHAGAVAKIDTVVERADIILDRGGRLVIFTSFKDVAETLRNRISQLGSGINVALIDGSTKEQERTDIVDSFQTENGPIPNLRVVISTAAGGEAITLTGTKNDPCLYMMIVDRPWTPGRVQQWEDRIHRISTQGTVTVYWMQMPVEVSAIDEKVDNVIQSKQTNINMAQYGLDTTGLDFVSADALASSARDILEETYKRVRGRRTRASR